MKAFIDNRLLQKVMAYEAKNKHCVLLELGVDAGLLTRDQPLQVILNWPSLLEYCDLGSLFETFPQFDAQNKLFALITSTLVLGADKDLLLYLYDQVFVEYLTQVKAQSHIHSTFLLDQIQKKRHSSLLSQTNTLFSQSLDNYEKVLSENPLHAMHDLTLYLAWDRVCANLALVFEYISPDADIRKGLEILKECLLESFQHITAHGRTRPGFFRLIEALYAYQMREENLQTYADSEWSMLCQSSRALRPREDLIDVFYIDAALVDHCEIQRFEKENDSVRGFTMDSVEKVKASLAFAHYMIEKLKLEVPQWRYTLLPTEIACLKESESGLVVEAVVSH